MPALKANYLMNTLLKIINESGYLNSDSNKKRAVRNINLLLDAGILQIAFVHADKYNDQNANWGYWYAAQNGKKRCTNYKINLYGKNYYGAFVPKTRTINYGSGLISTDYIDNRFIDIEALQMRIAHLISIQKDQNFMKSEVFAKYGNCSCSKCHGEGIIPSFAYYANGICFDCGGSGINRENLKSFIAGTFKSITI